MLLLAMDPAHLPMYTSASTSPPLPQSQMQVVYVMLPLHPATTVSPKARLAGLCHAMGYPRPPVYEVMSGEQGVGFRSNVVLYPPPDPHAEMRLQCVELCNSKRDAELAAAAQAVKVLLRLAEMPRVVCWP